MVKVFANGPGDRGSIPGRVILNTRKWYLVQPCLAISTIRKGSSGTILGTEWYPPQHIGIIAIEREAFGSPNFTTTHVKMHSYMHERWSPRSRVASMLNFNIVESEFELQSRH